MKPDLRQFGFAAVGLAVLTLIGWEVQVPADPAVAAFSSPTTSDDKQAPTTPIDMATTVVPSTDPPPTTTSSTSPTPRAITVQVYPGDAVVATSVSGASGGTFEGTTLVEALVAGSTSITVTGDGFRPEHIDLPADRRGTVEVWLDPADQLVDRRMVFESGPAPKQVAFTPDGSELWVTLLGGSGLEAYDPLTGELIAGIDLPEAGSVEVVFDADGDTAFVSQMETASVYEIDVDSHRVRRRLGTGGSWTKGMALSPDEHTLWASNWVSNDVSEFDLTTGELVRRIPTVTTPRGLAVDRPGSKLYVAGYDSGELQVIDLATGEGEVIHTTGGALRHLVADPSGGVIYASDMATDQILAVDVATDQVTQVGTTDRLPNTIDVTPDGRILAVSNRGRNNPETYYLPGPEWGSIVLLDARTGEMLDAVVGGNQPTGLDISADGRWLAYSDFLDNRVTVLALPESTELIGGGGGRSETYSAELEK